MPAVSKSDTYDALLTTTLPYRARQLWDNLEDAVTLFRLIENTKSEQSGHRIEIQLLYGANSTVGRRSDYDTVDMSKQDGITMAFVDWKDLDGSISISDRERAMNSGKQQAISLFEAKMQQLEVTMRNEINSDLFSLGSTSNQIQGLQYWLRTSTATVAGIDDSVNTWWQNQSQTSVGSFATNGRDKWRTLYNDCSLGANAQHPTDIITTQTVYEAFEKTFEPAERYAVDSGAKALTAGTESLKFKGCKVTWDEDCLSGAAYFLNTRDNRIQFCVLPDHYFKMTPKNRPSDQRIEGSILTVTGNLVFKTRRRVGVATGIVA